MIVMKNGLILILLFMVIAISNVPAYAEDSNNLSTIYGVNESQKTPLITVNNSKNTYTITPNTKPCDKKVLKYSTYNKYTKNYYTLITYMKKFEKYGGGTLILKKGTYTISNTVPIPSNVNLIFEDGVLINKGIKTGTRKFKASNSIFQLVKPSKIQKRNAYSKYNGVRNVKIIGIGNVVIDLKYAYRNLAIVCGHNQNIQIQGITFKNLNCGHFIEIDANNGMKISNCKFISAKPSPNNIGEAINLDTPDRNTRGFNNIWSSHDKTPNNNIIIENSAFYDLDRAIGTHKYSQFLTNGRYVAGNGQIYHNGIIIRNNIIVNMRSDAIRVINWKNSYILNNYIANVAKNTRNHGGVLAGGVVNLCVKYNYFTNMIRIIQITPHKNTGDGYMYSITYNSLNAGNIADMSYNYCINSSENFARINNQYKQYKNEFRIYILS